MTGDNPLSVIVPFSLGALGAFFLILAIQRLLRPRDKDNVVRGGFGRYHHFGTHGAGG